MYRTILLSIFTLYLASLQGCSNPTTNTINVHGNVFANNQPLSEGLITFVPHNGTTGKKYSTSISEGQYATPADTVLIAGDYRVEIYGMPPEVKALSEGRIPPREKTSYREIAPQYNKKSTLHCTLVSGSENRFDFSVQYAQ